MTDSNSYKAYLKGLKKSSYRGDICDDYANRSVMATDNSVYQLMPQAVLYPKTEDDVITIFQLANLPEFKMIKFAARGGGTGTNGQSLTDGIIINFTKYMNKIISHDLDKKTVTIQPGVILDQLNNYLNPLGYFFAPTVSPSNRATLGGMISTDACGKGSCLYGRTGQHIVSLQGVLADGSYFSTLTESDAIQHIQKAIIDICTIYEKDIEQNFPKLLRYMTGYNLVGVYHNGQVRLPALIAGSEGTLCTLTEATLKITRLPKYKTLFLIKHKDFNEALQAAELLNATQPSAVEVIDENIMKLAEHDALFPALKPILLEQSAELPGSINLVEYVADTKDVLADKIKNLQRCLSDNPNMNTLGYYNATTPEEMNLLWQLRKRSVELLGKMPEPRRPVSGIEDTVVDPRNLKEYIPALKNILDKYHLKYGMFGHVDAGCIHVRPALNLTDSRDEVIYQQLSDEVAELVKKHGGLIWGEHGKGFKSEYLPEFIGNKVYAAFREVKQLFDPENRLNPGKIAVPINSKEQLHKVKDKKKGAYQRQIQLEMRNEYASSLLCNGNAVCMNYQPDINICPSYKVTKDPVHSPKGRASIINEWLYLEAVSKKDEALKAENAAYNALEGCLGCKACITQCPVSVDIPAVKAKFYHQYFLKRRRKMIQYFLAYSEEINLWLAKFPKISNKLLTLKFTKTILKIIGLRDLPFLKEKTYKQIKTNHDKTICILADWITQCYSPELITAFQNILNKLEYNVIIRNDIKNAKAFYNQGMLEKFHAITQKSVEQLYQLNQQKIPVIGIEPSMTLVFRDELQANVLLPQEFLAAIDIPKINDKQQYYLLSHCSEKTCVEDSEALWVDVFNKAGLNLQVIKVGCCGMAGSYGHETKHFNNSKKLFEMSWQAAMLKYQLNETNMLVTGFSCREQVYRFSGFRPKHPLEVFSE